MKYEDMQYFHRCASTSIYIIILTCEFTLTKLWKLDQRLVILLLLRCESLEAQRGEALLTASAVVVHVVSEPEYSFNSALVHVLLCDFQVKATAGSFLSNLVARLCTSVNMLTAQS